MKKTFEILKKNFLIALRNPTTYLILLFGPILFVALIGLSFSSTELESEIIVDVKGETEWNMEEVFEDITDVKVITVDSEETCRDNVLRKNHHACLIAEGDEIDVVLDYSRLSRVYIIRDVINQALDQVSLQMTTQAVRDIQESLDVGQEEEQTIDEFFPQTVDDMRDLQQEMRAKENELDLKQRDVLANLEDVEQELGEYQEDLKRFNSDVDDYRTQLDRFLRDVEGANQDLSRAQRDIEDRWRERCDRSGEDFSRRIIEGSQYRMEEAGDCSFLATTHGFITYFSNETGAYLEEGEEIQQGLRVASSNINRTVEKLERYREQVREEEDVSNEEFSNITSQLSSTITSLSQYRDRTRDVGNTLQGFMDDLSQMEEDFDPEDVANPVREDFKAGLGNLTYLDYSLPIIVAFITLLSSLLLGVIVHRRDLKSKSFGRKLLGGNHIQHFLANYLFILLLIFLEILLVIGGFALFFTNNISINIITLIGATIIYSSLWICLGFLIGGVSKTEVGSLIIAIILGISLFLFSGTLVAIETFPTYMQTLAHLNPLFHFQEVLRDIFFLDTTLMSSWDSLSYLITLLIASFIGAYIETRYEGYE